MSIGDISLTGSMRNTLVSLQSTSSLMDRTQERLATGKRVNSALDNPANFFAAQEHSSRANQLDSRKDSMNEAIQAIKTADKAVTAISSLIENLRGIVSQARSQFTDAAALATLGDQYDAVLGQITDLANDAVYKGTNLVDTTTATLTVSFNEDGSNFLTLTAFDATITGLDGALTGANQGFAAGDLDAVTTQADLDAIEAGLNEGLTYLRNESAGLSSNLSIIQTRIDFTTNMVNTLTEGANKLTIADTNEEGANMLMLQTRQQLGTTALSLSSQAAQSVLRLF